MLSNSAILYSERKMCHFYAVQRMKLAEMYEVSMYNVHMIHKELAHIYEERRLVGRWTCTF